MKYGKLDRISENGLRALYEESYGNKTRLLLIGESFSQEIEFGKTLFIKVRLPIESLIPVSYIARRLNGLGIEILNQEQSLILFENNTPTRIITFEGTYPIQEGFENNLEIIKSDLRTLINNPLEFLENYFSQED